MHSAEEQKLDEDLEMHQFTKRELAYLSPRLGILNNIPFAIPFETRVNIFRSFVRNDQLNNEQMIERSGIYRKKVTIRRENVAQDGFDHLNELGPAWKGRLAITFVDQFGQEVRICFSVVDLSDLVRRKRALMVEECSRSSSPR